MGGGGGGGVWLGAGGGGGGGAVGAGGGGGGRLIFPIYLYRKLKKSSCQKPLDRNQYDLAKMFSR